MKCKLLALVCVVSVLVSLLGASGLMVNATEGEFQVGYARVNITPYAVDEDPTSGVLTLPLRGFGDVWNRPSLGLMDDNGDGTIDLEDGLFATCIAVSDAAGNTVLLITMDMIGVSNTSTIRKAICQRLEGQIEEDRIMLAGTHTHEAPDVSVYDADGSSVPEGGVTVGDVTYSYADMNTQLGQWIERCVEDVADAAQQAMADRAPATMRKGQLSASQSTAADGRAMNSVRHYWNEAGGCVAGDGFNSRGSDPVPVSEVNDNIYMLEFVFDEADNKENIVLANWRGHPSMNSTDKSLVSADYINAFCYCLKQNGYRPAFFQGAGGNVNPRARARLEDGSEACDWIDAFEPYDGNGYGAVLGDMALECLSEHMSDVDSAGVVTTRQVILNAERNVKFLSDLAYDAATAWQETKPSLPWKYTDATTGETFVIASRFHASSLISKWDRVNSRPKSTARVSLELNTIELGDEVAFVTIPGEPFDRYSMGATLQTANDDNDWNDLEGEALGKAFGTPFVLGYCNGTKSYIPNYLAYTYNEGSQDWAVGSYETHITNVAQGTGEKMIATFAQLLGGTDSITRMAYCEHCKETVEWLAVSEEYNLEEELKGHCYLTEDVVAPQFLIRAGHKLCLDLNGYSIYGEKRVFNIDDDGEASVFDSSAEQTGTVYGRGSSGAVESGYSGGTVLVDAGGVFNLYSGTLAKYPTDDVIAKFGGNAFVYGTFNMYGGAVVGGHAESAVGNIYGRGSAARINILGGTVSGGTVGQTNTPSDVYVEYGNCLTLSGDASIGVINYNEANVKVQISSSSQWVTVSDSFTGSAGLSFTTAPAVGTDLGTSVNAQLSGSDIHIIGTDLSVVVDGEDLVVANKCASVTVDGVTTTYGNLGSAFSAANQTPGTLVKLIGDVPASESVTLTQNAYLDLNGYDVNGSITVPSGNTLYCLDTQTDDYTVADGNYGRLTGTLSGSVEGLPEESTLAQDGYLKIRESDGVSFHSVNLQIIAMSLRAKTVGVYYKSNFKGDEVVARNVESFGVALSVYTAPTAANIQKLCMYSAMDASVFTGAAENSATGTLLAGIMKTSNSDATNNRNANMKVYGRAYIKTADGYIFGAGVTRCLKDQLTAIDQIWTGLSAAQQQTVLDMYGLYESVMSGWGLTNIDKSYAEMKASA